MPSPFSLRLTNINDSLAEKNADALLTRAVTAERKVRRLERAAKRAAKPSTGKTPELPDRRA